MYDMIQLTTDSSDALRSAADSSGYTGLIGQLPDSVAQVFRSLSIDPTDVQSLLDLSPHAVFDLLFDMFRVHWQTTLQTCLQLCGVLLLTAVGAALLQGKNNYPQMLTTIGGAAQMTLLYQGVSGVIHDGAAAIAACAAFEKSCLPVLAVLLTVSGRPTAALSMQGAALIAAQVLESFAADGVIPLIATLGAAGAVGAVLNEQRILQLAAEGRKLVLRLFALAASLFSAFLSLKAVIASSVDGLAVRGVKLAGSFLPVVGSAVGEAYATAIGAFTVLKNTTGIVLIAALFFLCLPVVIRLTVWIAALRLAGWFGVLIDGAGKELPQITADLMSTFVAVILLSCVVCTVSAGLTVLIGGGV